MENGHKWSWKVLENHFHYSARTLIIAHLRFRGLESAVGLHIGMNNLPKVVTRQHGGWDLYRWLLILKSNALPLDHLNKFKTMTSTFLPNIVKFGQHLAKLFPK